MNWTNKETAQGRRGPMVCQLPRPDLSRLAPCATNRGMVYVEHTGDGAGGRGATWDRQWNDS